MPLFTTTDWKADKLYELQTDLYTIEGIGAFGDLAYGWSKAVSGIIESVIVDPIGRVSEDLNDLYKYRASLDLQKELANLGFMKDTSEYSGDLEKDKTVIVVVAMLFLTYFILKLW